MKKNLPAALAATLLVIATLAAAGCGYRFYGGPEIERLSVGVIANKTFEPGLDALLHNALVREMERGGINYDPASEARITGSLETFELVEILQQDGTTVLYQVRLLGDFRLEGYSAKEGREEERGEILLPSGGDFPVTFESQGEMGRVAANRELAVREAVEELANEIISEIIYR